MFGRFEADDPNDRWTGDALHGPRVGGRKTYLFAFLDDHSRLIGRLPVRILRGHRTAGVAMEPALAARGVPTRVYVDNGSAFVDAWLLRACAKLGSGWCIPHPTGPRQGQDRTILPDRARTVPRRGHRHHQPRTSLAAGVITHRTAGTQRLLTAWIETEYHRRTHTETGQSPAGPLGRGVRAARADRSDADLPMS